MPRQYPIAGAVIVIWQFMDKDAFRLHVHNSIHAINPDDWNKLSGTENPFIQYDFLSALEDGGAVGANSGWNIAHLALYNTSNKLVGVAPHYLKQHSYGEYIFDHSWAHAFEPATGPRLLVANSDVAQKATMARGLASLAEQNQLSSSHINFLPAEDTAILAEAGWLIRRGTQFHWHNKEYKNFDAFLDNLSSRKRKNIRKERASVRDAGVKMLALTGADIKPHHIDNFYNFYLSTVERKWGGAYLTRGFFDIIHTTMADRLLLVLASFDGNLIGGALNFIGVDTLYGRNWGATTHIQNLHFEACYYQAIDFAISHKLRCVEAGAQGLHKVQRGYLPITTYSAHWIQHDEFRTAIARFLRAETDGLTDEQNQIALLSPFKKSGQ
jgi:predicted N-acyltransferase